MYQFKINPEGLRLLIKHEHADILNSFLQTDGESFDDIIETFLHDDNEKEFSGNVFQLIKRHKDIILIDKITTQQIIMKQHQFITLFQQWLNND